MAPFTTMTIDYKESVRRDIVLGFQAIMESGIELILPHDTKSVN